MEDETCDRLDVHTDIIKHAKAVRRANYVYREQSLTTKTFNKWIITFLGIPFFSFDLLYKTNWV